jgi:hypothetical protein
MNKEKAIKVLFDGNRILLPTNRWAKYHQLEHELYHHNSIDSVFLNELNVDLSKMVSIITDYGYGDIVCNMNYWLWLNEIRPIRLKILYDDTHAEKGFNNKESTLAKIEHMIKEWDSDIEIKFTKIRRSFGNILRTYKSALKGKGLFSHIDRTHRNMWYKYVPINMEQYVFSPLSTQMEWYPTKSQWSRPKKDSVCIYKYSPPIGWDLISQNSFENIGDKMIARDEKVVNKYWNDLNSELKKSKRSIEYLDYTMTPKQLFTAISNCSYLISSRGGFSYLAQLIGTPTVIVFPPKEMIPERDYTPQSVQFHQKTMKLFDPTEIANVDIEELSTQNTMKKTISFHKKKEYPTLESMQKLEKDTQHFQDEIVNVYREALKKDAEEVKPIKKPAKEEINILKPPIKKVAKKPVKKVAKKPVKAVISKALKKKTKSSKK